RLLAAASRAGAAGAGSAGTVGCAGSPATGTATAGEPAAALAAAAEAIAVALGPVGAGSGGHRRHRIVAAPGAGFELQQILPLSGCVNGLIAQFLLKILIGLAPLEL